MTKTDTEYTVEQLNMIANRNAAEAQAQTSNRNLVAFYGLSPMMSFIVTFINPTLLTALMTGFVTACTGVMIITTDYTNGKKRHMYKVRSRVASAYAEALAGNYDDKLIASKDLENNVNKAAEDFNHYAPFKDSEHISNIRNATTIMLISGALIAAAFGAKKIDHKGSGEPKIEIAPPPREFYLQGKDLVRLTNITRNR